MLKADSSGRISGIFTIPSGVPVGSKSVTFRGSTSEAQAVYRAEGWKTIETWGNVETTVSSVAIGVDPLAQIITVQEARMISGVDIKMTAIGNPNNPVIVQLRSAELGLPTREVLAESWLAGDNLVTGRWLSFDFGRPVLRREDQETAIVILTEDAHHAVAVAKVGGYDPGRGWVTGQPYRGGTLLSSADAMTWRSHPEYDLTMRVRAKKFTANSHTIALGAIPAEKVSDLILMALAVQPEGTEIEVTFTLPSGQRHTTIPMGAIRLADYVTGDIGVDLTLRGNTRLSPVLIRDMQAITGTICDSGDYVSRAMSAGIGATAKVVIDTTLTGTGAVKVQAQTGAFDGVPVWADMPIVNAAPLGDGVVEHQYELPVNYAETRIRVAVTGGPAARSEIANLRAVITEAA